MGSHSCFTCRLWFHKMFDSNQQKYFSVINFCQTFFLCRRRQVTKRFEELSAKAILEHILKKKSSFTDHNWSEKRRLSRSTPDIHAQINENFSFKPKISIKSSHSFNNTHSWNYVEQDYPNFQSYSEDYRYTLNKKERKLSLKKENRTNSGHNRHKSFKHNRKMVKETSSSSISNQNNFQSCPNLHHLLDALERNQTRPNYFVGDHFVDNVDDFTTNLFIDDFLEDDSKFDLVSINFD